MTVASHSHIVVDERGRALIEGTGAKVVLVVMEMMKGATPAEIHDGYPHLSMSQIHAALTYYYDHQVELDAEVASSLREFDALRAAAMASGKQPSRAELEKRLHERSA